MSILRIFSTTLCFTSFCLPSSPTPTAQHAASKLQEAIQTAKDHLNLVSGAIDCIVETQGAFDTTIESASKSPLETVFKHTHYANRSMLALSQRLLESKGDFLSIHPEEKRNYLHYAAIFNVSTDVLCDLIDRMREQKNSDDFVSFLNGQDHQGRTPLHLAARHGSLNVVLTLLGMANIKLNEQDGTGKTPLLAALKASYDGVEKNRQIACAHALLDAGAEPDIYKETPPLFFVQERLGQYERRKEKLVSKGQLVPASLTVDIQQYSALVRKIESRIL